MAATGLLMVLKLHQLPPDPGKRQRHKRVGRGEGSGEGKTSGKGHKGHQARSGREKRGTFEGGQVPLVRRLPKFGFNNPFAPSRAAITLRSLNRFPDGSVVDLDAVKKAGLVARYIKQVKLVVKGELERRLTLRLQGYSEAARRCVEAKGGTCEEVPIPARACHPLAKGEKWHEEFVRVCLRLGSEHDASRPRLGQAQDAEFRDVYHEDRCTLGMRFQGGVFQRFPSGGLLEISLRLPDLDSLPERVTLELAHEGSPSRRGEGFVQFVPIMTRTSDDRAERLYTYGYRCVGIVRTTRLRIRAICPGRGAPIMVGTLTMDWR